VTENDPPDPDSPAGHRVLSERTALALAASGVRSSSVRLSPTVHGTGDHGFISTIVAVAREKGVSGYLGDGTNRWPAVARPRRRELFRLASSRRPGGLRAARRREEGVPLKAVAEAIGPASSTCTVASVARSTSAGSARSSASTRALQRAHPGNCSVGADPPRAARGPRAGELHARTRGLEFADGGPQTHRLLVKELDG
jgi:hypothetical protein